MDYYQINHINNIKTTLSKQGKQGLPGIGFKLTDTGDYDINNKKLTNVAQGSSSSDAITKHQLDSGLNRFNLSV